MTMNDHTKSLLQALIDGKPLERLDNDGKWGVVKDLPFWALHTSHHSKLRVKQPTIRIGEMDVPEPLRVAPADGTECWVANTTDESIYRPIVWSNRRTDRHWLAIGAIHLSKDAAIAHAKALIVVSGGTV